MSDALTGFNAGTATAQALWVAGQEALARSTHSRRDARNSADPAQQTQAKTLAKADHDLHRALVEAAAVRLSTAWEVFLSELFVEYLLKRPVAFKTKWRLAGTVTISDETVAAIVEQQQQSPFQSFERARKLLRDYLGDDLFGEKAPHKIDVTCVEELVIVRNAIVHRAGKPTKQFHLKLKTRRSAHSFLMSRPGPKGSLPATQFDRLLLGVTTAAHALHHRAFQRPRPSK